MLGMVIEHEMLVRRVGDKFCSVIGEIVADLATGGGTARHDIGFLRFNRSGLMAEEWRAAAQ